jgi:hypothetical protein
LHWNPGKTLVYRRKVIYNEPMWEVEYTDEFKEWLDSLERKQQKKVATAVGLLQERGISLPFPHSSGVSGSRFAHMRELRVQSQGDPIRVFYAFDPKRSAILLIGGSKTGDDRFYERLIHRADNLYEEHLQKLRKRELL